MHAKHLAWRFSFWQKGPLPKTVHPKGPCQYHSIRTILSKEPHHPLFLDTKHFSLHPREVLSCEHAPGFLSFSLISLWHDWILVCISEEKLGNKLMLNSTEKCLEYGHLEILPWCEELMDQFSWEVGRDKWHLAHLQFYLSSLRTKIRFSLPPARIPSFLTLTTTA